jgi:carbon-monoxide dehydrogenase medium subunit
VKNFEYLKVHTISKACNFLAKYDDNGQILAGGTDLIVKIKQHLIQPDYLIDIKGIDGLEGLHWNKSSTLKIGALTTIRTIETSPLIKERVPILMQAAKTLGSVQVRHLATIGGNLCTALPSADMAPSLIALNAFCEISNGVRERKISLEEFFVDSGKNALQKDEILTHIGVPKQALYTGGRYLKHADKNAVDVAIVSVAALVGFEKRESKSFENIRIVLGAAGPTPIRAKQTETYLKGRAISERAIEKAGEVASEEALPRTRREYKKEIVKVLTRRAINQALAQALSKSVKCKEMIR